MSSIWSREAQLAISGTMTVAIVFGLARYGYGLFVPVFRREFDFDLSTIGYVASAAYGSYWIGMVAAGWLSARIGPRLIVSGGLLCAAFGMALIATATGRTSFILGAILAGASPGLAWAPFSEAVPQMVRKEFQARVLSIISTGTTFGMILTGPLAFYVLGPAPELWRHCWIGFALTALIIGFWALRLLPSAGINALQQSSIQWSSLLFNSDAKGLYAIAFIYGFVAAFYFTYAVSTVWEVSQSNLLGTQLWMLIGLGGLTGIFSAEVIRILGLKNSLIATILLLAVSYLLLPLAGDHLAGVTIAALLFGIAYMPIAAFLVIWSGRIFSHRPAAGFSVVLFFLSMGSMAGPAVLGFIGNWTGLGFGFFASASLLTVGGFIAATDQNLAVANAQASSL